MAALAEAPTKKAAASAKITLPLRSLQKAMATVAPAVQRNSTIPILGNVCIEQSEGTTEFVATNLDMTIRARIATADAKPAEAFLLPALKLDSYAKLLQGDVVTITHGDESRATLRCGRSNTKLPLMPKSNFPAVEDAPGTEAIRIKQGVAERVLKFTTFAISHEESRYTLNGALIEVGGDTLSVVATDGHRLARYTVPIEAEKTSMLAPAAFLAALDKTIGADADAVVRIETSDSSIFATVADDTGRVVLSHRRLTGQFPNYKAVMPKDAKSAVKIDAATAAAAVKRCLQFADENSSAVKLTLDGTEIKMHSVSADAGETDEVIDAPAVKPFEPFSVGFNGEYLLDVLSRLTGDVALHFKDAQSAVMFVAEPHEGETFECVVMPMRV
jgi:DNA polymerase III subunit beta